MRAAHPRTRHFPSNHPALGALLEASLDAMVIVDRSGRIATLSSRSETLFGYSRLELVGKPVEILVPERFHGKHPGHRASGLEFHGRRKDATEFPVEISLSPWGTKEGTVATAAMTWRICFKKKPISWASRTNRILVRLIPP